MCGVAGLDRAMSGRSSGPRAGRVTEDTVACVSGLVSPGSSQDGTEHDGRGKEHVLPARPCAGIRAACGWREATAVGDTELSKAPVWCLVGRRRAPTRVQLMAVSASEGRWPGTGGKQEQRRPPSWGRRKSQLVGGPLTGRRGQHSAVCWL